jgi:lysophospholipase L1-like esterase
VILAGLGLSAAGLAVPAIELRMARRGPKLVERDFVLDGPVGHGDDPFALQIVWLGDSLAAGVGADDADGALPRQVARHLTVPVSLRVLARSGAKVSDVVREQLPHLARLTAAEAPDLIMVSVGANDVGHLTRAADFLADYDRLLTACAPTPVVVLGVPNLADARILAEPLRSIVALRARRVDRLIRRTVARFEDVEYIDIARRSEDAVLQVAAYLCVDRYHPNEHGYRLWASTIAARLHDRWAAVHALRAAVEHLDTVAVGLSSPATLAPQPAR